MDSLVFFGRINGVEKFKKEAKCQCFPYCIDRGYAWIARSLQEVINEHFIFFDTERKGVTYIQ